MLKETMEKNAEVKVNSKEMEVLQKHFPSCFDKDGKFDIKVFEELIKTEDVDIKKEGYSLDFLGKSYARYLASLDSETVIVPDEGNKDINSENIYIVGDNLDALQHLKYSYSERIKCIYIDPPYNTGSDGFVYNDKFEFTAEDLAKKIGIEQEEAERVLNMQGKSTHSAWLTFMYPRLELAKDLLSDDGCIFISIGQDEGFNLVALCNSIFGENNKVGVISRMMKSGGNKGEYFSPNIEYVLVYAKNKVHLEYFREPISDELINKVYNIVETEGPKKGQKFRIMGLYQAGLDIRPNQRYWVKCPDGSFAIPQGVTIPENLEDGSKTLPVDGDGVWRWSVDRYLEELKNGNIYYKKTTTSSLLIVDEGQDFSPMMLKALVKAVGEGGSFTFFGDVAQQIYGNALSWKSSGIDTKKVWRFENNYRNPVEIAEFAQDIVKHPKWEAKGEEYIKPKFEIPAAGVKPMLIKYKSIDEEKQGFARLLKNRGGRNVIIVKNRQFVKDFMSELRKNGVMSYEIRKEQNSSIQDGVYVSTFHSAKGLEFDNVFIPYLNEEDYPDLKMLDDSENKDRVFANALKLFYVAVTRARQSVIMSYSSKLTKVFPENSVNYIRREL